MKKIKLSLAIFFWYLSCFILGGYTYGTIYNGIKIDLFLLIITMFYAVFFMFYLIKKFKIL